MNEPRTERNVVEDQARVAEMMRKRIDADAVELARLRSLVHELRATPPRPVGDERAKLIRDFHGLLYAETSAVGNDPKWRGVPIQKNPNDLMAYQEIIHETKPDVIVETGTYRGGSALFFADILTRIIILASCSPSDVASGVVFTIDTAPQPDPVAHERVHYVTGSSADPAVVGAVLRAANMPYRGKRLMVVLDADHRKEHVLAELDAWAKWVSPGCYLVVEDGNINGRPVLPTFGPGPSEALAEWLPKHLEFEVDETRARHLVTFNPGGYLRRKAG